MKCSEEIPSVIEMKITLVFLESFILPPYPNDVCRQVLWILASNRQGNPYKFSFQHKTDIAGKCSITVLSTNSPANRTHQRDYLFETWLTEHSFRLTSQGYSISVCYRDRAIILYYPDGFCLSKIPQMFKLTFPCHVAHPYGILVNLSFQP
ncbi:hypothetical protein AVEN_1865-1 [Araneus ventricosus]|uniref:Uncharacterized protein n=1 Tax=Araneus ventricosus TaxID=182803 RepID=A0A4Y2SPV7_ARAVE|nr:hypothetical protein AVEN_1865-1 [Araneus ventricosus]